MHSHASKYGAQALTPRLWDALDWVREYGPARSVDYAEDMGLKLENARKRFRELERKGLIAREMHGASKPAVLTRRGAVALEVTACSAT